MTPMRRFKLSLLAFALLAVLGMLTVPSAEAENVAYQHCMHDCEVSTWTAIEICEELPFPPGRCSELGTEHYDLCAEMCAVQCF